MKDQKKATEAQVAALNDQKLATAAQVKEAKEARNVFNAQKYQMELARRAQNEPAVQVNYVSLLPIGFRVEGELHDRNAFALCNLSIDTKSIGDSMPTNVFVAARLQWGECECRTDGYIDFQTGNGTRKFEQVIRLNVKELTSAITGPRRGAPKIEIYIAYENFSRLRWELVVHGYLHSKNGSETKQIANANMDFASHLTTICETGYDSLDVEYSRALQNCDVKFPNSFQRLYLASGFYVSLPIDLENDMRRFGMPSSDPQFIDISDIIPPIPPWERPPECNR